MATVTDLATVAAATAAGYQLITYTTGGGPSRSGDQTIQKHLGDTVAILEKRLSGSATGEATYLRGQGSASAGIGGVPANLTTAKANALSALNAVRRHRYAGAPGTASGTTVAATLPDGTTPLIVDTT